MARTAKFSNGHEDTYKGRRDIRAAWMVVTPEGKILSGHSMDRTRAEKTARNHAAEASGEWLWNFRGPLSAGTHKMLHEKAVAAGYQNHKEHATAVTAKRADFVSRCNIEIVDMPPCSA